MDGRSPNFLKQVADEYPAHIYVYDVRENRYTYVNRAFREFHDSSLEQLNDGGFELLNSHMHPDDLKALSTRAWKENESVEFRQRDRQGQWHWFSGRDRVFTRCPETGRPQSMIGCVVEINGIMEAKRYAEESLASKSQFLANVSHEIRTPLNAILGFTSILEENPSHEQAREFLGRINRNGVQLLHLLDDVLNLAKFEVGEIPLQHLTFALPELIEDLVASLQPQIERRPVEIRVQMDDDVPMLFYSDPFRLRQILANLLNNALKFTPAGQIEIEAVVKQQDLWIRVKDSGIGIAPDQVDHLFLPFRQADPSISRRFGGTGLGLALSRRLANALNGDLELTESQPGKGSCFTLRLPIDPTRTKKHVTEEDIETPLSLHGERVLVAEDSPDSAFIIQHYLERAGARVHVSGDGREVLDEIARQPYTAVILDLRLPDMNGFEIVRTLRERGVQLPIIAATAQAEETDQERARAAGFDGIVRKPLHRETLISTLVRLRRA